MHIIYTQSVQVARKSQLSALGDEKCAQCYSIYAQSAKCNAHYWHPKTHHNNLHSEMKNSMICDTAGSWTQFTPVCCSFSDNIFLHSSFSPTWMVRGNCACKWITLRPICHSVPDYTGDPFCLASLLTFENLLIYLFTYIFIYPSIYAYIYLKTLITIMSNMSLCARLHW